MSRSMVATYIGTETDLYSTSARITRKVEDEETR